MFNKLFLLLFFVGISSAFAQETIQLKGKIIADSIQGSSINIVNLSNFSGTTNASDGSFEIKASVNDTLFFSSVQFKKKQVIVSPEIFGKGFLEIQLEENI
ncbi:MAG: carboxypeptidase-like regulatory domain-containing protein, partial [Gillisia sp.]